MTGGRRATWMGGIGRGLAGLLVLILLVLAAVPVPARALPTGQHDHHAAHDHPVAHRGQHGAEAAPARHGRDDGPSSGGHRDHRTGPAALACCVAMHCPMMTGGLPDTSDARPLPSLGAPALAVVPAPRRPGLNIPPALPPPRIAA